MNIEKLALNIEEFNLIWKLALILTARIKTQLKFGTCNFQWNFLEHGTLNVHYKNVPPLPLESFSHRGCYVSLVYTILRLLPTFVGVLGQKNRTRLSLDKTLTNYISESLINVLYEKNTILGMFSFRMSQEPVRRETIKGSSIDFMGYLIPQYEQNDCTVLFTRHQSTKMCRTFSIFWLVV